MSDEEKPVREIRINPITPTESVLVATARSMRPRKQEDPAPRDTRKHADRDGEDQVLGPARPISKYLR